MKNPFRWLIRKYRRWRGKIFFRRFRKMFAEFDKRLQYAEFTRHERRILRKAMIKDIKYAERIIDMTE